RADDEVDQGGLCGKISAPGEKLVVIPMRNWPDDLFCGQIPAYACSIYPSHSQPDPVALPILLRRPIRRAGGVECGFPYPNPSTRRSDRYPGDRSADEAWQPTQQRWPQ